MRTRPTRHILYLFLNLNILHGRVKKKKKKRFFPTISTEYYYYLHDRRYFQKIIYVYCLLL